MRKMKDSGVEWIGEIPEDWEVVTLKNLCTDLYSGGTPTASNSKYYTSPDHGLPFINISDLTNNKFVNRAEKHITTDAAKSKNLKLVNDKYILLAMYASTGTVSILSMESYISQAILAIQTNSKLKKDYLYYFLESFRPHSESYSRGTTQSNLSAEIVKNLKIAFPRIEEQKSIIKMLDNKTSTLDDIKATIIQEIETLEAYKKSVITEVVTKGLDKSAEMKVSGIEWIGEIPKHWHLVKLKFLTETIAKGISPNYTEEELSPVVNQATFSKGYFDYNLKFCRDELKGDGLLKKNDVLLATTGGGVLGKTFYFQEKDKYLASTDVAFLRCKSEEVSKFIYYVLSVNYDLLNGEYAKGSTNQTHLQMDRLSNMEIPWPGENELKQILTKVDHSVVSIEEVIAMKQNQLSLLDEYKKSLIYEYVTGKREV